MTRIKLATAILLPIAFTALVPPLLLYGLNRLFPVRHREGEPHHRFQTSTATNPYDDGMHSAAGMAPVVLIPIDTEALPPRLYHGCIWSWVQMDWVSPPSHGDFAIELPSTQPVRMVAATQPVMTVAGK